MSATAAESVSLMPKPGSKECSSSPPNLELAERVVENRSSAHGCSVSNGHPPSQHENEVDKESRVEALADKRDMPVAVTTITTPLSPANSSNSAKGMTTVSSFTANRNLTPKPISSGQSSKPSGIAAILSSPRQPQPQIHINSDMDKQTPISVATVPIQAVSGMPISVGGSGTMGLVACSSLQLVNYALAQQPSGQLVLLNTGTGNPVGVMLQTAQPHQYIQTSTQNRPIAPSTSSTPRSQPTLLPAPGPGGQSSNNNNNNNNSNNMTNSGSSHMNTQNSMPMRSGTSVSTSATIINTNTHNTMHGAPSGTQHVLIRTSTGFIQLQPVNPQQIIQQHQSSVQCPSVSGGSDSGSPVRIQPQSNTSGQQVYIAATTSQQLQSAICNNNNFYHNNHNNNNGTIMTIGDSQNGNDVGTVTVTPVVSSPVVYKTIAPALTATVNPINAVQQQTPSQQQQQQQHPPQQHQTQQQKQQQQQANESQQQQQRKQEEQQQSKAESNVKSERDSDSMAKDAVNAVLMELKKTDNNGNNGGSTNGNNNNNGTEQKPIDQQPAAVRKPRPPRPRKPKPQQQQQQPQQQQQQQNQPQHHPQQHHQQQHQQQQQCPMPSSEREVKSVKTAAIQPTIKPSSCPSMMVTAQSQSQATTNVPDVLVGWSGASGASGGGDVSQPLTLNVLEAQQHHHHSSLHHSNGQHHLLTTPTGGMSAAALAHQRSPIEKPPPLILGEMCVPADTDIHDLFQQEMARNTQLTTNQVITHEIGGFIIQESLEPFALNSFPYGFDEYIPEEAFHDYNTADGSLSRDTIRDTPILVPQLSPSGSSSGRTPSSLSHKSQHSPSASQASPRPKSSSSAQHQISPRSRHSDQDAKQSPQAATSTAPDPVAPMPITTTIRRNSASRRSKTSSASSKSQKLSQASTVSSACTVDDVVSIPEPRVNCSASTSLAPVLPTSPTTAVIQALPNPQHWTVEQVCSWVCSLGGAVAGTAEVFRQQEIDGGALFLLNDDHLRSMGLKLGPAVKLCAALKHLRSTVDSGHDGLDANDTAYGDQHLS